MVACTPLQALRRLVDIARQIDADECPELYNQLQGELAVAGAVLAEAAQPSEAAQLVNSAPAQEPVAYRTTFNDFRHFSGAIASGRDYVQFQKPVHDSRFFEGCDSLVITPLYAAPQPSAGSAAPAGEVERDAVDAARYRLLRDGGNHDFRLCQHAHSGMRIYKQLNGEEMDRIIDRAAKDHKNHWMTAAITATKDPK